MKLFKFFTPLAGTGIAVALTLALVLPAQEPKPAGVPSSALAETSSPEPVTVAADEAEATSPDDMRELGADIPVASREGHDQWEDSAERGADLADDIAEMVADAVEDGSVRSATTGHAPEPENDDDARHAREKIVIMGDAILERGERAREVVAILGSALVDGIAEREVVAVLGDVTINGSSGREVVAVLGNVTINGKVEREVVAVLGSVQLGPEAVVGGEIIAIGGTVDRAPGAQVGGGVNQIAFLGEGGIDWLKAWVHECLLMGRPLAIADNLGWLWVIMGVFLGVYCLIALLTPTVVTRCAETMEQYPGMSVVAALLTILITPIAMIVLAVTVVGPLVLGLLLFFVAIFGKVVFLAWLGRRITEPAGWKLPVLAVLIGGLITLVIYLVPVLGFVFQKLAGFLGTGIVVYTIILAMRADGKNESPVDPAGPGESPTPPNAAVATPPPPLVPGGSVVTDAAPPPPPDERPPAAAATPPLPTEASAQWSTLPRVGFWGRFAATLIDTLALAIAVGVLGVGDYFALAATTYFIVLWALRGTTLGGVVLGIKVVRLDDRPVDWPVALVRALGSFLSLCVLGLGFIWVAWDPQRQSWHDKIAGTTVVKMPRGVSLI